MGRAFRVLLRCEGQAWVRCLWVSKRAKAVMLKGRWSKADWRLLCCGLVAFGPGPWGLSVRPWCWLRSMRGDRCRVPGPRRRGADPGHRMHHAVRRARFGGKLYRQRTSPHRLVLARFFEIHRHLESYSICCWSIWAMRTRWPRRIGRQTVSWHFIIFRSPT